MRTRALNPIRDEDRYTDVYKRHYCNQCGGSFPVFRGLPHQTGSGLGDILRAVGRFVLPIFAPAASRFITSAAEGIKEGQTLKESAKRAVGPALSSALDSAGAHLTRKMSGSGRKRRRANTAHTSAKRARTTQTGLGKSRRRRRKVYKRKPKKGHRTLKHARLISANF